MKTYNHNPHYVSARIFEKFREITNDLSYRFGIETPHKEASIDDEFTKETADIWTRPYLKDNQFYSIYTVTFYACPNSIEEAQDLANEFDYSIFEATMQDAFPEYGISIDYPRLTGYFKSNDWRFEITFYFVGSTSDSEFEFED